MTTAPPILPNLPPNQKNQRTPLKPMGFLWVALLSFLSALFTNPTLCLNAQEPLTYPASFFAEEEGEGINPKESEEEPLPTPLPTPTPTPEPEHTLLRLPDLNQTLKVPLGWTTKTNPKPGTLVLQKTFPNSPFTSQLILSWRTAPPHKQTQVRTFTQEALGEVIGHYQSRGAQLLKPPTSIANNRAATTTLMQKATQNGKEGQFVNTAFAFLSGTNLFIVEQIREQSEEDLTRNEFNLLLRSFKL